MTSFTFSISFLISLAAQTPQVDASWPTYLGPNGDGIVTQFEVASDWESNPPQERWRKQLGVGNASFVISNGKIVTTGNLDDTDIIWCLDPDNGNVIWKHEYEEPQETACGNIGPSTTPTIDGNRVYSASGTGKLFCLDLNDGRVIWQKHYVDDFAGRKPICGWAASPHIEGDLLIVDPGSRDAAIVALDKMTGDPVWTAGEAKAGCSTPLRYSHKGKAALAFFHGDKLIGYDLENKGEVLYEFPWRTFNQFNASKPRYLDGRIFVSSGYGEGYAVIDLRSDEPALVHRDRELPLQFQNSLLIDGDILGIFGDNRHESQFLQMNMLSGEIYWQLPYPGNRGNLLALGDKILAITETGKLIVGQASREGFETFGEIEVLPEKVWTAPAFANGSLYLRNKEGETVCLSLSPKA